MMLTDLPPAELHVLRLACLGFSDKEIAVRRKRSELTVRKQLRVLYRKSGLHWGNRIQLFRWAMERGLVRAPRKNSEAT